MKNNGGYAFPAIAEGGDQSGLVASFHGGMTLRDYFAAAALSGMLASGHQDAIERASIAAGGKHTVGLALASYGFADAMLKTREEL